MMSELAETAAAQGIEPAGDEAAQSDGLLKLQIKALVAERLFPREGFYRVMNAADGSMFRRAVELLGAWSEQGKQILRKENKRISEDSFGYSGYFYYFRLPCNT